MDQQEDKVCEYCGNKIRPRVESLSKGLVDTLILFAQAVKTKGINDIHLQTEMRLSNNAYNNFQKLRYHGLVHWVKDASGSKIAGHWLITLNGGRFLRGDLSVPKQVVIENNRITQHGTQMVRVSDFYKATNEDYWQKEFSMDIFQGRLL